MESDFLLAHRTLRPVLVLLDLVLKVFPQTRDVINMRTVAFQSYYGGAVGEFVEAEDAFWIILYL